jgi:ElaB/YqjD/DUF883 family membrane-anchored ribosome-binding protein
MADLNSEKKLGITGESCPPGTTLYPQASPTTVEITPLTHGNVDVEMDLESQARPETTMDKVKGTLRRLGHSMQDTAGNLAQKSSDLGSRIRDYDYRSVVDSTRSQMASRPMATMLLSAGVGFGLGWMLLRRRFQHGY